MSKRILVVDDDHDILDLLEYNLVLEGFKVKTEDDSTHAVATCLDFDPDLIILDIMMPEINGIEVCKQIRSIRKFKDTFIFFYPPNQKATTRRRPWKQEGMIILKRSLDCDH